MLFRSREAEIVAKAGQRGSVTIATNMAGRGTDIKLGEGVVELDGLAILGTERHESRRIDNQLRGRSGRQGDPGFSQFFVAMNDDLMRRFGGEKMARLMETLGIKEDESIENKMISRSVENAQKKIEAFHFDARKHVVQYDDVMNIHREKMYVQRRKLLGSEDISGDLKKMVRELVRTIVGTHCPGPEVETNWNVTKIFETMNTIFISEKKGITLEYLEGFQYRDDLIESLIDYLLVAWEAKKQQFPPEKIDEISKYITLRSIDELWLEHINNMTQLRDRVALSGYAQKDPVTEYRREAFEMFKKLLFEVRLAAVQNLFRVQFEENLEIEAADYTDTITNEDQITASLEDTGEYDVGQDKEERFESTVPGRSITAEKLGEKYANIGRNDPCPCGSGKKFKKCHGRSL